MMKHRSWICQRQGRSTGAGRKHTTWAVVLVLLLVETALFGACAGQPTTATSLLESQIPSAELPSPQGAAVETDTWWNDAVFYEIFVRSFYDSDGDGIGDLEGVIEKLDYLNDGDPDSGDDLGVTGIWLMPVMQSPSYHGYDATDYYTVEEDYGSNETFKRLIAEAHARGIKVIVDLMLNHTSSQHAWFVEAAGSEDAARRDWYVWRDENPAWRSYGGAPTWHQVGDQFYYGLFWEGMPDLNYANPAVTAEMSEVTRFWLEQMGADGLRLDAIRHLFEADGQLDDLPETHAWLRAYDDRIDEIGTEKLTVGEVWDRTPAVTAYVAEDEVDLTFEFALAEAILRSVESENPFFLANQLGHVLRSYPPGQFAPFLTNHDQDRVMSQLGGDEGKARLAASILLILPGVPFIYYGEEIGMIGQKPDELIRTPMPWSAETGGAFTSGTPWEPLNQGYEAANMAGQASDPTSLLSHYRRLIGLRNDHAALRRGDLTGLDSSCQQVFGYLRHHGDGEQQAEEEEAVLVVHNFGAGQHRGCQLSLHDSQLSPGTYAVQDGLSGQVMADLTVDVQGAFRGFQPVESLGPQQSLILLLQER